MAGLLRKLTRLRPSLGIVLGSGFRGVCDKLEAVAMVPYAKLGGFPVPGTEGHAGRLLVGWLGGTPVVVLSGRGHYYEGFSMESVTFPVRALAAFGIRDLLLTNAAGAINPRFRMGDFMLVTDHINFMGTNPLRGQASAGLSPFVDASHAYDVSLCRLLRRAARECGIRLRSGVYMAVCGPSYETAAEIRAYAGLGADAVGMSTVPEVVVGRQCGMRTAALSCLTNLAAGMGRGEISHSKVLETVEDVKGLAAQMLETFAKLYAAGAGRKH